MTSAGWKLVSPTRGQTLDRSRRCDEGDPARESVQALVGRKTQALLDEAPIVVLGVLDLSTQSVPDRGLIGARVLGHGASVLPLHRGPDEGHRASGYRRDDDREMDMPFWLNQSEAALAAAE